MRERATLLQCSTESEPKPQSLAAGTSGQEVESTTLTKCLLHAVLHFVACRRAQHEELQLQLEASQQQVAALQQQLQDKQQECADASSSGREQAAATALLQQQLQLLEGKLLDQAQQRGQEQQQWQQRLVAAEQRAEARVRTRQHVDCPVCLLWSAQLLVCAWAIYRAAHVMFACAGHSCTACASLTCC